MMIGNIILCANMFAGPGMSVTDPHGASKQTMDLATSSSSSKGSSKCGGSLRLLQVRRRL